VVEIVNLATLDKQRVLLRPDILACPRLLLRSIRQNALILTEGRHIARLHIDNTIITIAVLQQLGYNLAGLTGFYQLTGNKTGKLVILKRCISRQASILFIADEMLLLQQLSMISDARMLSDIIRDRILIALDRIELLFHQHTVGQAVILDPHLRIDMIDIIIRRKARKVNRFSTVHAFAHLREIQIELCTAQAGFIRIL